MTPEINLLIIIPLLAVLTMVCIYQRCKKKAENEEKWKKNKEKYRYRDHRY